MTSWLLRRLAPYQRLHWTPLAAVALGACFLCGSWPARAEAPPTSLPHYAVIIVLDGARPNYFNLSPMPHLRWLMRHGTTYSQATVGQMIADTPPSHATIGSGVFPRHHGIQGFWWKDPATDQVTRPTDTSQVEAGALERVLSQHNAPSIAAQLHARDPTAQVVSVAGHKCYAADAMGGVAANDILCALIYHDRWVAQAMGTHRPPPGAINNSKFDSPIPAPNSGFAPAVEQWKTGGENTWTVKYALWAFHRIHYPRVLMMNLGETDVLGHFAIHPRSVMRVLMRDFDRELGQIVAAYRSAGILQRTDFVVTADHGMSRVRARVPFSVFDQAIAQAGAQKVFLEADTGAALGITNTAKARAVALNVARLGASAVDATYYKTVSPGGWAYRPAYVRPHLSREARRAYLTLMDTAAGDDGPDVLVAFAPHVTTGDRPVRGYHWLAGHLGPQWDEQHIPLIIAGAGVRHGRTSSYPARLVDIAPTVERLLGVPTGRVDGHVLADALDHATSTDAAEQNTIRTRLAPMVAAIRARSGQAQAFASGGASIVTLDAPPQCSRLACRIEREPIRSVAITGILLLLLGAGVSLAAMRVRRGV